MKVNLKIMPYNLSEEQIIWVENMISSLSLEDKIKQLFYCLTPSKNEDDLIDLVNEYKMGGVRYNPGRKEEIFKHNYVLQSHSDIPLFIAANTENGGNGAFVGGTEVGGQTKVAATNDLKLAYALGKVSAVEAKAVGINVLFAPIVDIHSNFHNPIISTRTFGNDPIRVKNMSLEYLKAVQEENIYACAKHFPGDGYDERDQHLASSVNPLSVEEWNRSFGEIYSALINNGLPMVMAGHIKLPSYQKHFNPSLEDKDYLPATVSKELITNLLKEKLHFNGLVVTDATHMVGLTSSMKRSEFLPKIIESGCDMILFYNDLEEDFNYMLDAVKNNKLSKERIDDALRRILGLKIKLGNKKEDFLPKEELMNSLTLEKHLEYSKEVCKKGITLVKNLDKDILPISLEKHKRILIVPQEDTNPFEMFMPKRKTIFEYLKEKLENEGFEVTIFESLMDKIKKMEPMEALKAISNVYGNKTPITDLTDNYDLIIQVAHFMSHNTVQRISWKLSKGTADVPWYVHEVPTIFVSLNCPFHLFDVPQVRTYINCYDKNQLTIDYLCDKLVGKEKFVGISPVDAFCGDDTTKY